MSVYLDRYASPPLNISNSPQANTGLIVVIPVFNETETLKALNSLIENNLPKTSVEVLVIINQSIECDESVINQNTSTLYDVNEWIKANPKEGIKFYVQHISLPKKHAGVGLARKAGMDEATRRFEEINNENGIILCFDADCTCSSNYLNETYKSFLQKQLKGASIYYEHNFEHLSSLEKEGILQYELHLRYYVHALKKAGYPYAFHTVGSSMAVRVDIYKKAGGMNKRKAGEDFHFLHKVIPYGNFEEITSATVYPSARMSDRVPFGTGKAMYDWITKNRDQFYSYHPQIFNKIEEFIKLAPLFYKCPKYDDLINKLSPVIQSYLEKEKFKIVLRDINRQSNSLATFVHRWFSWFNGLKILHLVHYLRDHSYPSIPVKQAAAQLIKSNKTKSKDILGEYRMLDREFTANQINLKHQYFEHQ